MSTGTQLKTAFSIAIALGFVMAPAVACGSVDLAITNVEIEWAGAQYFVHAEVTLQGTGDTGTVTTQVNYYADGAPTGSEPYSAEMTTAVSCEGSYPDCDGNCPAIIIDYQLVPGSCSNWVDPGSCACVYVTVSLDPGPIMYGGESSCTVVIDEEEQIEETDEMNNSMTVPLTPPNIDLSIEHMDIVWDGGDFVIEAMVKASVQGEHDGFVSDVTFYVDGAFVGSIVYDAEHFGPNPSIKCEDTYPACNGLCKPTIINGNLISGNCTDWFFENKCSCIYLVLKCSDPQPYSGQMIAHGVVDDTQSVEEADETNNDMYAEISGTPAEPLSWTLIKALYK